MRKVHFPTLKLLRVISSALVGRKRSFQVDAQGIVRSTAVPVVAQGLEHLQVGISRLLTVNHTSRSGLPAWWVAAAVSSVYPDEITWIMTAAWNYPDALRARFLTPITRSVFGLISRAYGFLQMPPMPPRPADSLERGLSVRRIMAFARQAEKPVIGLAPEGMDSLNGSLSLPPPGVGRFIRALSLVGLTIQPVGVHEEGESLMVTFGAPYTLEPPAPHAEAQDESIRRMVMKHIAALLPVQYRGDFSPD